ncbi:hypothetical protein BC829DRAFT_448396 [Chytridium lagenaria]|nr:hypothetical protein BC829DRAFT_448396 [Chytridium lagenaria]
MDDISDSDDFDQDSTYSDPPDQVFQFEKKNHQGGFGFKSAGLPVPSVSSSYGGVSGSRGTECHLCRQKDAVIRQQRQEMEDIKINYSDAGIMLNELAERRNVGERKSSRGGKRYQNIGKSDINVFEPVEGDNPWSALHAEQDVDLTPYVVDDVDDVVFQSSHPKIIAKTPIRMSTEVDNRLQARRKAVDNGKAPPKVILVSQQDKSESNDSKKRWFNQIIQRLDNGDTSDYSALPPENRSALLHETIQTFNGNILAKKPVPDPALIISRIVILSEYEVLLDSRECLQTYRKFMKKFFGLKNRLISRMGQLMAALLLSTLNSDTSDVEQMICRIGDHDQAVRKGLPTENSSGSVSQALQTMISQTKEKDDNELVQASYVNIILLLSRQFDDEDGCAPYDEDDYDEQSTQIDQGNVEGILPLRHLESVLSEETE